MVYFIALIILLVGIYRYDILKQRIDRNSWFWIEWLVLVLVAGFRYKIGGDTYAYMEYYDNVPTIWHLSATDFVYSRYQPLFIFFSSLVRTISSSFVVFQLIHAVIVNTAFLLFFRRNTEFLFTSIFFYAIFFYFNYNTEIIRGSLAVAVFLFTYEYLIKKEWKYYILGFLLAYGFHAESLIMLLFPLCHLTEKISSRSSLFYLISVIALFTVIDYIPIISSYLDFNEDFQYSFDVHSSQENDSKLNMNGFIKYILTILLWGYCIWIIRLDETKTRLFLFWALICSVFAIKYNVLFGRAMDFVYPILIIEMVNLIYKKHFFAKPIVICFLFYLWSASYFWKGTGYFAYRQYFPYVSYFDPYEDPVRTKIVLEYHPVLSPE